MIPIDKSRDGIRVFILGESAAMGTPDPSFGFARILEVLLGRYFPDRSIDCLVSTVGVNLRDCPPLGSLHRGNLALSERQQWDRLYQEGIGTHSSSGRIAESTRSFARLPLDGADW